MDYKSIKIADFDFRRPYRMPRKTSFNYGKIRDTPGIYMILKDNEIVYVGMSSSCTYRALFRHFQKWNPDKQKVHRRQTYNLSNGATYLVAIMLTDVTDATHLETELIQRYRPTDNTRKHKSEQRDRYLKSAAQDAKKKAEADDDFMNIVNDDGKIVPVVGDLPF